MNLATGTVISQLPTGTIDGLNALMPVTINVTGTPQTIQVTLLQEAQFLVANLLDATYDKLSDYVIVPSVSSGALSVMISGTFPQNFRISDTNYTLSSPSTITAGTGTSWCNAGSAELAAQDIDYFVYAIGETGASAGLKFGFSRIPYALTMNDFVNTAANEKYIKGNWTNFNSTDKVTVIGRFRARLSASPYVWSIPNSVIVNRPIYVTGALSWTPSPSASGSLLWGTFTMVDRTYQLVDRRCFATADVGGFLSGTASNTLFVTLPFDAAMPGPGNLANAQVSDPSSVLGWGWITDASPDKATARKSDASNFSVNVSGTMRWVGNYVY